MELYYSYYNVLCIFCDLSPDPVKQMFVCSQHNMVLLTLAVNYSV